MTTSRSRSLAQALRTIATAYPDAEETIACAGTALESTSYKAGKTSFLFVGPKDVKLKLAKSLPEAKALASKDPERVRVGSLGWVTVTPGDAVPVAILKRWIDESFQMVAGASARSSSGATSAQRKKRAPKASPRRR
jgi:hypothetical protein